MIGANLDPDILHRWCGLALLALSAAIAWQLLRAVAWAWWWMLGC